MTTLEQMIHQATKENAVGALEGLRRIQLEESMIRRIHYNAGLVVGVGCTLATLYIGKKLFKTIRCD